MKRDYAAEIDKAIWKLESHGWTEHNLDWCCNRVDWCWKWRKITEKQKDEFCDRLVSLMGGIGNVQ